MIDIRGIDKARLLLELYDGAVPRSVGAFARALAGATPVTYEDCVLVVRSETKFDYFGGRPLKVDLGRAEVDEFLYDRNNGAGACARAVERARAKS